MVGAWVVLKIVVVTTQSLRILAWALAHIAFLLCFAGMEVGLLRSAWRSKTLETQHLRTRSSTSTWALHSWPASCSTWQWSWSA
jgi:hypothetical protein